MQSIELAGVEQRLRRLLGDYTRANNQSSLLDILFGVQSALEQALDVQLGLGAERSHLTFSEKAARLLPDLAYGHGIAELCRQRDHYAHVVAEFAEWEIRGTTEGFINFALDAWRALFGTAPPATFDSQSNMTIGMVGAQEYTGDWQGQDADWTPEPVPYAPSTAVEERRGWGARRWLALVLLGICTIFVWAGLFLAWTGTTLDQMGITLPFGSNTGGEAGVEPGDAGDGVPESTPGFSVEAYNATWTSDRGFCLTCRIPNWAEPERPGEYEWQIQYAANQPALLRLGWCAADEERLDDNWSKMRYELVVDEHPVDVSTLALREQAVAGQVCRFYAGMLRGWAPGSHSIVWRHSIDERINDGWESYEPGAYVMRFIVDVG